MPILTEITSPCVKVCRLEEGVCIGCGRTQDQIRMWTTYSNEERNTIMETLCGQTTTET